MTAASEPTEAPRRGQTRDRQSGALGRSILLRSFYLVLSVTLVMGVVAVDIGFNAYRNARLERLEAYIEDLRPSFVRAAWQINDSSILTLMQSIFSQPEVVRIAFKGDLQNFKMPEAPDGAAAPCDQTLTYDLAGSMVGDDPLPSGMITICYQHQPLDFAVARAIAISAVPMLLAIFITSFGVFLIVQRMIVSRIYALTEQVNDDSFLAHPPPNEPNDELTALSLALHDRTRRLQAEREIAWAVFKNIDDGVIVTDSDMTITRWNAHAAMMLRSGAIKSGETRLSDVIDAEILTSQDRWIEHVTEDQRALSFFRSRLGIGDGRHGYVVVIRDQTEKKRLEREAIHAQRMSAIGSLSSGVAHDFNNFLAVIIGNVELMQRAPDLTERNQRLLGATLNAAKRGAALTDQLLTFARKQSLRRRAVTPDSVLSSFGDMSEQVVGPSISLTFSCNTDDVVDVDPAYLETALLNLVINARDAMPNGGAIAVSAHNEMANNRRHVVFSVRDQGVGIPKDLLSKVSEPFFTTKKGSAGTGLGLSMVTGFAEQSGGFLKISSRPGETVVSIYLPAVARGALAVSADEDAEKGLSLDALNILVVDDQAAVAETLSEHLLAAGHRVAICNTLDETAALQTLHEFDLVLCDVVLVGASGMDVWRMVRDRGVKAPFIFVSGNIPQPLIGPLLETGAPLLRKPFSGDDLLSVVYSTMISAHKP